MPAPSQQERLRTAQEFIAVGRLEEAEVLLEEIAAASDPDTLNARATLALALHRTGSAFEQLAEAATRYPDHADLAANLGIAHERLGHLDEAIICLKRAAALAPLDRKIKFAVARALKSRGDLAEARAIMEALVLDEPGNARAHLQLGTIDLALRRFPSAEVALRRALELAPDDPEALRNVSALLLERGCFDEALNLAQRAYLRAPLDIAGLSHLAHCLAGAGLWSEAETTCRRLLASAPMHLGAREALARVMIAKGEEDQGIAELTQFVHACKSHPSATLALASILQFVGRFDQALRLASHVANAQPDDESVQSLETKLALSLGRFPTPTPVDTTLARRILVPPATDALEFVALVRLLNRLSSQQNVQVVAEPHYRALLSGLTEQVVLDEPRPELPATSLQSLLGMMSVDSRNIADGIPYLRAEPKLMAKWRDALAAFPRPLIGIVWQGGALGLSMEQAVAVVPQSVTPVSLMSDAQRHDLKRCSRPIDAGAHIDDPAELIAAIANLDAVAGPDSFAVHIAGALGVPGVVFLPRGYPWYWAQGGGKPLWYPSFEVVVQVRLGQWAGAINEARERLEALLRAPAIA